MKSALWSVAKYALAIILLTVILRHAQTDKILGYIAKIPTLQLIFAFLLVTVAQFVSALRMRYLFHRSGFRMHVRYSVILFYVGAFYNFLLPGGIGGDAYKVILARRRMSMTVKQGIRIMLADRASGLFVVMIALFSCLLTFDFSSFMPHAGVLVLLAAIVTLAGYLFFSRWLLKQRPMTMLGALPYSFLAQGCWIATILTIWHSLSSGSYAIEYVALYCAASISSMLPVSVGGLGLREMTYYYGAQMLQRYAHSGVDGDMGIAISLCSFFLTFAAALPGLLWLNKVEKADFE